MSQKCRFVCLIIVDMNVTDFEHIALTNAPEMMRIACNILCNADDAQDVVQETLLAVWHKQRNVRDWRSFLLKSVRNRSLNNLRDNRPERHADLSENSDVYDDDNPETLLIGKEEDKALSHMIAHLSPKAARIMVLSIYEQKSISEIAKQLGETEANVRQIISRSRRTLINDFQNNAL